MSWLEPAELAEARAAMAEGMTTPCQIEEPAAGTDDGYGTVTPGAPTLTATACRVHPLRNPRVEQEGGKIVHRADSEILLPYGTTVSVRARIILSDATYRVHAVDARTDALLVRLEALKLVG
jgi:hypothetical protein